jgi:hypothetical protein
MEYETAYIEKIIKPKSDPIFSERATRVQIEDEAAGCFVEVSQEGRTDIGKIQIDDVEWPLLRKTINEMLGICAKFNAKIVSPFNKKE